MTRITERPGAGVTFAVALGFFAALCIPASAGAETLSGNARPIQPMKGALSDALHGERAAFSNFANSAGFARAAGLEPIETGETEGGGKARARIEGHNDHDTGATGVKGKLVAAPSRDVSAERQTPITDKMIATVTTGTRLREWRCLTEALYFEARGEDPLGQVAVAEVVLNRVDSPRFPDSVCAVLMQGAHRRNACQFSYNCDGRENSIRNRSIYNQLGRIANEMLAGAERELTGGALFYHATSVKPGWTRKLVRTARIGSHVFYRHKTNLSSR